MSNVKSIKGVSLASLLLFLGAFTLTPEPVRLSRTLRNIEAYALVSALASAQWPDQASIPAVEAAFEFAPMMAPRQGLVVDIIRDHYRDKSPLDGQLRMPFGELVDFRYHPEPQTATLARQRKDHQDYEKLYAGSNKIRYAAYSIASLAFPGERHEVLLADGAVSWTGVQNEIKSGWTVVGEEPSVFIGMIEVREKAVKDAIPWAGFQKDAGKSYYETLKSYRSQELTLPVVGAKIPWSSAGLAFTITALYLSVLFMHAMLRLRDAGIERDEPWLLVEPCRPRGKLERVLVKSMTVMGGLVLALFMSLPIATIVLVRTTVPGWAFVIVLAITSLLTLLALKELTGIARRGEFTHREAENS